MSPKVYVIAGANRGIGLALVKQLSDREDTTVIATARQPAKATDLNNWAKDHPNVHTLKYDAAIKEDAYNLAKEVEAIVDGVDVLIANGAIGDGFYTVLEAPDDKWIEHYNINVLGPIFLFKAFYQLVKNHSTRKVIFVSSDAGSITGFLPLNLSAYGQSKAALNYTMKEISYETKDDKFIVISLHPGVVGSDMGVDARQKLSALDPNADEYFEVNTITPAESAKGQIELYDKLTLGDSGKFFRYDGTETAF